MFFAVPQFVEYWFQARLASTVLHQFNYSLSYETRQLRKNATAGTVRLIMRA